MRPKTQVIIIVAGLGILCWIASMWVDKPAQDGKTVLIWVTDDNPARASQVEAFNRENSDLVLTLDSKNIGVQNLTRQISSGIGPDLFDLGDQDQQAYVETGLLWDVTDMAEKMGFSVRKQGWPASVAAGLYSGRQYGYYCNVGAPILIYNKNVFDYFGIPYPKEQMTWDEFLNIAIKVNSQQDEGGSRRIYAVANIGWWTYFESTGGELITEEGLVDLRSEKLANSFQWYKDILFKYKLTPDSSELKLMTGRGGWGAGSINQFADGHFAMITIGDWALARFTPAYEFQLAAYSVRGRDPTTVAHPVGCPLRLGASLLPYEAGTTPQCRLTARIAGINPQSPNRTKALRVLQYFAGPTYSELLNQGTDWLPGNPAYADSGVEDKYPDLSRSQIHKLTKKSLTQAYVQRQSPFVLMADVSSALWKQADRLETDRRTEVTTLLADAESEVQTIIRRRIARDPGLKEQYERALQRARSKQPEAIPKE